MKNLLDKLMLILFVYLSICNAIGLYCYAEIPFKMLNMNDVMNLIQYFILFIAFSLGSIYYFKKVFQKGEY